MDNQQIKVYTRQNLRSEAVGYEERLTQQLRAGTARWGHWRFVPDSTACALRYVDDNGHESYEVDLDRCDTREELLDWLFHLDQKNWITAEDLGTLVQAWSDILGPWWSRQKGGKRDVAAIVQGRLR